MNFSFFTVFLKNRNISSKILKIKSYRVCSFNYDLYDTRGELRDWRNVIYFFCDVYVFFK